MKKTQRTKKILKIIGGVIIFITLPSLLFFGFMYFKYHEDLPEGIQGPKAEQLAQKMLDALNIEAYEATDYLEWTFKGIHHYQWNKTEGTCKVSWDDLSVTLDFNNPNHSKVFAGQNEYQGNETQDYIIKAQKYFNNDSFWLVAPYKVFDKGTERRLVQTKKGSEALLVSYTLGGTTPGDSYLWHLDANGKPTSFQMWVDIIPIGGLEASWDTWTTTESGAMLPTNHRFLVFNLEMTDITGIRF